MDTPRKINGMQKFYSKLMHKIEDFPPKLQLKLTKAMTKEERKERDRSCDASCGTAHNIDTPQRPPRTNKRQRSASHEPPSYENILVRTTSRDDSDTEDMKMSKISLEDEIFEELEKAAHDEHKLNAVIQNFDKILHDYTTDRSISEQIEANKTTPAKKIAHKSLGSSASLPLSLPLSVAPPSLSIAKPQPQNIFYPPPLQKAKTCSIIESKCILKKNAGTFVPNPPQKSRKTSSHEDELDKYVQITKSLMNLHDLSELAKKLDKHETERLKRDAIHFSNYNTYKVTKPATKPSEMAKKSQSIEKLPIVTNLESPSMSSSKMTKTKSVCELSRANSGLSKIPVVKASPQPHLKYFGPQTAIVKPLSVHSSRSSSYIDMPSAIPLTTSAMAKSVSTRNLPLKPLSHQVPTINVPMQQHQKGVTSKKGIPTMKNAVSTSAINAGKLVVAAQPQKMTLSPTKNRLKSAVSDLSLHKTNTSIKRTTPVDPNRRKETPVRSPDKRLSILKKAQDLKTSAANTDDVDFARISSGNVVLGDTSRRDFVLKSNNGKQTIKKSHSRQISPVVVVAATNRTNISNGNREITTKPKINTPPKPKARTILPSAEIVSTKQNTKKSIEPLDRAYQSDCSDDSGHISNEADDNVTPVDDEEQKQHAKSKSSVKTGRISEALLEKFETNGKNIAKSSNKKNERKTEDKSMLAVKHKEKDTKLEVIKCNKNSVGLIMDGNKNVLNDGHLIDVYLQTAVDTEVLFRSGVLTQLEAKRDELLSDRIVQLQAYCRGHLARKRVSQRRVQELAVKCIQRNVRAFMQVRDWPWWRLLVRVSPLLAVNRTEEQLKIANDELVMLKAKLEKLETERNSLKTENQRLEAKLTDMTVDLADEHSSANITSERLEAETSERLRLEKELEESQKKFRNLQETSEKLEMELICAKSDLNGVLDEDDPDNEDNGGVYKIKYERVARELEFTKKRLQTQHEHDLEQLVGLKKQLEKKLADAYEEVEEQRQVVGQWKRKVQKMTNEMNDLRMLLEEQNSRNNLLEKRQRKFDVECQSLQDATRQEKLAKERLSREKDVLVAEKFQLDQALSDTRLELELKEEKLNALQRELEEMTFGGGTEEEVAQLKRSKLDLEKRYKEQEEELDEMAGQIQLLEQAKLRLEMSLEQMRKDSRREATQRDEELEEIRGNSYKKIKALECQLESEHEERTLLLREKHELERRLNSLEDQDRADRAAEEAANQKLKRDLRKYKALLRDAQSQLERAKGDSAGKAIIRQLRNQLEDAESARTLAQKARQAADNELAECQSLLEEAQRGRSEAEDRAAAAHRDRTELQAQLDENEEELSELMKKYSATVKQLNAEQAAITEYELRITELESEKSSLKEQIAELNTRLENMESMGDSSAHLTNKRLELRTKELESRLEFEQTTRARLEVQVNRHKEAVEKANAEMSIVKAKEMAAQDQLKKAQKSLRELRDEFHTISNREQEVNMKRKDLEKRLEAAEAEAATCRQDLRLAMQRISDLQQAMEADDDSPSESESESSDDSLSDLDVRLKTRTSSVLRTSTTKDANGIHSDTTLIIREEKDSIPRHTLGADASSNGDSSAKLSNGDSSFA